MAHTLSFGRYAANAPCSREWQQSLRCCDIALHAAVVCGCFSQLYVQFSAHWTFARLLPTAKTVPASSVLQVLIRRDLEESVKVLGERVRSGSDDSEVPS